LQTALEWLKKFGLVSEEVKSIYDLRDTLDLYTTYKDTLKKNLFEDSMKNKKVQDYAGILIKIEALKAGEF
jgi:hypothetical protein